MKLSLLKKAFLRSLPVMAGYIVLGIGFGILLRDAGYGPCWALTMAVFIYAGSMQYVGINLITGGASVLTTLITTLMVNARHLFYSISMIDRYKDAGHYKPYLIFALTDETYTLLCDDSSADEHEIHLYRFLVSLFNHFYWITGCVLGSFLGAALPFSTVGIEFSMTALFIAVFTEQWMRTKEHIPAVTGLTVSLLCLLIFGPERFLIPSMLVITLALTLIDKKQEAETVQKGDRADE